MVILCISRKSLITIVATLVLIISVLTSCSRENTANINQGNSRIISQAETEAISQDSSVVNLDMEDISQNNMMDIIKELTSEKYKGRLAGTEENSMAAKYIIDNFKKIGLENPRRLENYKYDYLQSVITLKEKPVMQIFDKEGEITANFNYSENFVLRRLSSETNNIVIDAPLCLIDDIDMLYNDTDKLKGKVLLVPWKYYSLLGSQNWPDDYAIVTGALGVISEFDLEKNDLGYKYLKLRPLCRQWSQPNNYKPFAFVDSDTFSKLVKAAESGSKLHFACSSYVDNYKLASNCIGLIPGSDPELKNEFIIIGAHFDHLGDNMNGTWNPGALDNASGTAAMIEIARVIKESNISPKKSILFIAFNGEESGIRGSWNYCVGPVYPMDKAVMINIDMVGSTAKLPLSIGIASDKGVSLRDTLAQYANKLSIEYEKITEDGSDHSAFDNYGVPAVCLINLDLGHGYHSPHDTIETVNGDRLEEVTKLVLYYIAQNAY